MTENINKAKCAAGVVEELLGFSLKSGLVFKEDVPFCRNLLMDTLGLDAPAENYSLFTPFEFNKRETASLYLDKLCDYAVSVGKIESDLRSRELFSARLMGCVTLSPSAVNMIFRQKIKDEGVEAAADWFYDYSRKSNYIQVDAIAKNIQFPVKTKYGELFVTINLSKPEYDAKSIAERVKKAAGGYPRCALCVENTGNAGDSHHAPRQNHRMVPITLEGESWHMQYSPYLYYEEHCIALSDQHTPMKIDKHTFTKLLDFLDIFPHYFIGSNSDLPIMSGSIMSHIHFQGGKYLFPMDVAPDEITLESKCGDVTAALVNWPMTCVRLKSKNRDSLISMADDILAAWIAYSDEPAGIFAFTDARHNTITPIARKHGNEYILSLVLRNNRTSAEFPDGIFHPHPKLHHIKKENIGLIEVMGLFILPGRLVNELKTVEDILCGKLTLADCPEAHAPWVTEMLKTHGIVAADDVQTTIRAELAEICEDILEDAGVFKYTPQGRNAFMRFWSSFTG